MIELTTDQLHTLSRELQRRDPRFLRIVATNPAEGQGEYEVRSATTGRTLRQTFTFCEHGNVLSPRFDAETRLRLAAEAEAAPNPYAAGIAKLRAASATDLSRFEADYKRRRLDDVMAMRAALDAEEPQPRMTAAEEAALASYAPPDPYAAGLKALREKKTR
jgi:hypothetical protein